MNILKQLTRCEPVIQKYKVDPVIHRRNVFVKSLKKQLDLIPREKSGEVISRREKWWVNTDDGIVATFKYATTCIEYAEDSRYFTLDDLEELVRIYSTVIEGVQNGEFDEVLGAHWDKSRFNPENREKKVA